MKDSIAPLIFTDSHAHLEMVIQRIGAAAVRGLLALYRIDAEETMAPCILDIGVDPGDLARRKTAIVDVIQTSLDFSKLASIDASVSARIFWAAGIWPNREVLRDQEHAIEALVRDLDSGVNALGECGLDYHHMEAEPLQQIRLFSTQAEFAAQRKLPLIVHSRDAFEDTLNIVAPLAKNLPIVVHCFGYGPEEAEAFLRAGCYLSFAGNITYAKSAALREALSLVPIDRLLLETDAPYMNPLPHRGIPSNPLDIVRTYQMAATLKNLDLLSLRASITANLNNILFAL